MPLEQKNTPPYYEAVTGGGVGGSRYRTIFTFDGTNFVETEITNTLGVVTINTGSTLVLSSAGLFTQSKLMVSGIVYHSGTNNFVCITTCTANVISFNTAVGVVGGVKIFVDIYVGN